ncbi:ZYRO0B16258p [Zygosaccharomyces rouxii]|uniref:RING-type E3 ubiquitin transferase n=1 Tax=Zygosaccharomyces rouxii (strain ATCC 2623 / CBS 732 / NBRC 1130 / NCYC 568 / NRRL Y-229) TaxID=559307 RepID=C5DSE7_ZYGRC|nr:uncharacterized protein ZYRO0B16258g [Zygosaccharomyces rouxii]KAH9199761.1 hypothetical protein LQ764DRAFT_107180 [Zygosaccharomyces rouxii]CAR26708.1 ZYRO0B16258p [Zygosaccharomyces rouxii]
MYNPVAFSAGNTAGTSTASPAPSVPSSTNSATNTGTGSSSRASATTAALGMTNSASANSATMSAPSQGRRRRGSGLNSFLNSFGIRQNSNNNSNNNNNSSGSGGAPNLHGAGNTNNPFLNFGHSRGNSGSNNSTNAEIGVSAVAFERHSQPPHGLSHAPSFHELPISISLTAQQESTVPNLQPIPQNNTVSASSSPLGNSGTLQRDQSGSSPHNNHHQQQQRSLSQQPPQPLQQPQAGVPIAGIDPIHPEAHTYNGTTSGGFTHTPNTDGVSPLKNLRHYIYAADQPNADELLGLDLARNVSLPESLDEETLQQRKDKHGLFSIRLTPFIDGSFSTNPGLSFDPVIRTAGPGSQLVIGRYTERVREAIAKIPEQYHPVVFKSKVVSRTHGCFKVDSQGNWFIRDVRSSSGTFLNHQRLAPASTMSKDTLIHDGDILQLGMDFRGGTEEIYRCVKMRVEINRSWKRRANAFNKEALQRIKNIQRMTMGLEEEDCSICLSKIKPCQAMFISPCSHSWHFQCIRRLVMTSYPQFVCPNCRCACDLEASLESSESESEIESDGGQLVDELGVLLEDPKDVNMG